MENVWFGKKQERKPSGANRLRWIVDVEYGGQGRPPTKWEVLIVVSFVGSVVFGSWWIIGRLLEALLK